jgi:hypothetical protein
LSSVRFRRAGAAIKIYQQGDCLAGRNPKKRRKHMKYERPQIIKVVDAVAVIQSAEATKFGLSNDSEAATSPAYEADE